MSSPSRELNLQVVGTVAFVLQGLYISSYGPMYPRLLEQFHLAQSEVGWIASANFLGSSTAVLASTWLIGRVGARRILMVAPLLLALGAMGMGVAPTWGLALLCALVAGLGAGSITSGINITLASTPDRPAAVLNTVNAMFGLGCVLGPLLVASTPVATVRWPFILVGLLALTLLVFTRQLPKITPSQLPRDTAVGAKRGITLFTLLFAVYVMTEAGAGSWMTTHLTPQLGLRGAAVIASGFWLAFMVGRLVGAPLTVRFPPRLVVPAAASLAIVAAGLANLPQFSVAAYLLLGLALGPIFPTTVAWYRQHLTSRRLSIAMTGGSLGAVAVQPLIGLAVSGVGLPAIPLSLVLLACALLMMTVWVRRFQRIF